QDDFPDVVRLDAGEELPDLELVGADPVERREGTEEHVIAAAVLAGPLHRHEVVRFLHNAEQPRVPRGVIADPAGIGIRHVEAAPAMDGRRLAVHERLRQVLHAGRGLLQQVEGQALGRLGTDAGQALQRLDQPGDGGRVRGHAVSRDRYMSPGSFPPSPPVTRAISLATSSRAFRSASLAAASTRSSSICGSSGETTSRSMRIDTSSWFPLASTTTMPPPAEASTFFLPTSSLRASSCAWSFWASLT